MDLFEPLVPVERQHRYFRALSSQATDSERSVVLDWAAGFPDRDGKFVIEFQSTFNSCFWELYLNAAFTALGLRSTFDHPSPDFVCTCASQTFVAEAAIASHADGYAAEWETLPGEQITPERKPAMIEYASIRLSNALHGKIRKYRSMYSRLPHVANRPFVICLAPFEQPLSWALADRAMRRVLYAHDMPVYEDDHEAGVRRVWGETVTEHAWKQTGAEIAFGLFNGCDATEISAVIFSNVATFGKVQALAAPERPMFFSAVRYNDAGPEPYLIRADRPNYRESVLDGLHLFLNPHALHAVDPTPFLAHEVAVHYGVDAGLGTVRSRVPDRFLISRSVVSVRASEEGGASPLGGPFIHSGPRGNIPDSVSWPADELRRVGGHVGPYKENHLAHYEGWTILVAQDEIDGDWGAQACLGVHRDLASWIDARKLGARWLVSETFVATRDGAWIAMRRQIDALELPPRDP